MLEGLIQELFDGVLDLLDVSDLCSLRLSGRNLEQRSRATFRAAAFSNVVVDFSKGNMQWLGDISSSEIRLAVRSLEVRDGALKGNGGKTYGDGYSWPRLEDGTVNLNSDLVRQFVDVLSLFPKCTSATVTDTMAENGHYPCAEKLTSADVLGLVLHAYSTPGAPPLQLFRMHIDYSDDWEAPVGISINVIASAQRVFTTHLQELILEFDTTEYIDDPYTARIMALLTAASKVRTLRLMWRLGEQIFTCDPTICQLGWHLDAFPDFAPPLENLTLGEMFLTQGHLLRLLARCRDTLTSLLFYDVRLKPGYWSDVLDFLRTGSFHRLRRIAIYGIRDDHYGTADACIAFCPLWNARVEMQKRCGGTLEFGTIIAGRAEPGNHVEGVIYESENAGPAMISGLQAMVEYSHRETGGFGVPCEVVVDA